MNRNFYHLLMINILWLWFIIIVIFCTYVLHSNHWSLISSKKVYVLSVNTGKVLIPLNQNGTKDNDESFPIAAKQADLAILITNLGLDAQLLNMAMKLPPTVTLGFSPYSNSLSEDLAKAKNNHYEVLINIPLKFSDPLKDAGPLAMAPVYDELDFILNKYSDAVDGVYTDPGDQASKDAGTLEVMLNKISQKKLLMCYGGANNAISGLASKIKVPVTRPYIIISSPVDKDLSIKLRDVESQLRKNRKILLSITASVANLSALGSWLSNLDNSFVLVKMKKMAEY